MEIGVSGVTGSALQSLTQPGVDAELVTYPSPPAQTDSGAAIIGNTYHTTPEPTVKDIEAGAAVDLQRLESDHSLTSNKSVALFLKAVRSSVSPSVQPDDPESAVRNGSQSEQKWPSPEMEALLESNFSAATLEQILDLMGGQESFITNVARLLEMVLGEEVPKLTIRFTDVEVSARVSPAAGAGSQATTIGGALKGIATAAKVKILQNCTGKIRPGKMTLLLGGPGSGKSSLLKVLSGRLMDNKHTNVKGRVDYNGVDIASVPDKVLSSVGYVTQRDIHTPTLTVEETVQFSFACLDSKSQSKAAVSTPSNLEADPKLRKAKELLEVLHRRRPQLILKVLVLEGCRKTVIGNAMLRGVSGGEKKRVTTAEVLVRRNRALYMDEISTGLDSAATFDICTALKKATEQLGATIVISLLQPPPEVYQLFHDVILIHEGQIAFHGPREEILPYIRSLGYAPLPEKDAADFLVELLSDNREHYILPEAREEKGRLPLPVTGEDFSRCWRQSDLFFKEEKDIRAPWEGPSPRILLEKEVFALTWTKNLMVVADREWKVFLRNRVFVFMELFLVVFAGLLYGIVFYDSSPSQPVVIVGVLFLGLMFASMGQASQLANMFDQREVFYKQRQMNMMRSSNYVFAMSVTQIPMAMLKALVFGNILYWLVGFQADVACYLYFIAMLLVMNVTLSQYFFFISCAFPSLTAAMPLVFLSILLFVMFSGFTMAKNLVPDGWIWMYYLSPIQWSTTGLVLSQYKSEGMQLCELDGIDYCAAFHDYAGNVFLRRMGFPTDAKLRWIAFIVLLGLYLLFGTLATLALEYLRHAPPISLSEDAEGLEEAEKQKQTKRFVVAPQVTPMSSAFSAPSKSGTTQDPKRTDDIMIKEDEIDPNKRNRQATFTPATLSFKDLWYTVKVKTSAGRFSEVDLLKGVSGCMKPGTMTALMGSSGAGKTTLLDVIASRKTSGIIRGDILINGIRADSKTIRRCTGYCEQTDIHAPTMTIHEALIFSAKLRQDRYLRLEEKMRSVQEAIVLLEFQDILDFEVRALSPEQSKRLTIGVELVANPAILFLDEPTSGLDARAAFTIMKGVRNVASANRTVVCTIHQPSSNVFFLFDSLLLLRRGGSMVYYGAIGENGRCLIDYLEGIPGTPSIKPGYNPATYMLEVIGAGVGRGDNSGRPDYAVEWTKSPEKHELDEELRRTESRSSASTATGSSGHESSKKIEIRVNAAAAPSTQFIELLKRFLRLHWRSPQYHLPRFFVSAIFAAIFASLYGGTNYRSYQGALSGNGMIYLTFYFLALTMFNSAKPIIYAERAAFYREQASRSYSSFYWWLCLFVTEIPGLFVYNLVYLVIFFPSVGFVGVENFFLYWLTQSLFSVAMVAFAQLLIGILPNIAVAAVCGTLINMFLGTFSGFNPPTENIPRYLRWLMTIMPSRYAFSGLVAVTLTYCSPEGEGVGCLEVCTKAQIDAKECVAQPLLIDGQLTMEYKVHQLMEVSYGIYYADRYVYACYLLIFVGAYGLASALVYRYINWTVR